MVKFLGPVQDFQCYEVRGNSSTAGNVITLQEAIDMVKSLGKDFSFIKVSITSDNLLIHDNSITYTDSTVLATKNNTVQNSFTPNNLKQNG